MLDKVSTHARKRTVKWLGAAAVAALIAGGAVESGLVAPTPAHAELRSMAQPVQGVPSFADVIERVKPAVVAVKVKVQNAADRREGGEDQQFSMPDLPEGHPMERFFRQFRDQFRDGERGPRQQRPRQFGQSLGSGFFISADGYVVTNNHVIDKASEVEVTMDDGKVLDAKVVGTDPKTDLALLKVEGSDFPYVRLAGQKARIGDWVLAVGNPFGLGGTVTAGIVSAQHRDIGAGPYDDFIQIDAPVNKGNSGGPTFDVDGNVIGVNTAIFSPSGGSVGIAFAIPADTVKTVIAQLKDKGSVTRGWIGVQIQPVTAEIAESIGLKTPEGALVADPQADGPAAKAGIVAGDVITAVNGKPVKDARDLAKQIGVLAPGATAKLTVWRKGEEKAISLTLGELPKAKEARASKADGNPSGTDVPKLGLTLAPAGQVAGSGSEGVVVTNVDPDGVASEQGFKTGDVILEVGGKKVASPADVRDVLAGVQKDGKRSVLMRVKSGENTKFVALRLGQA